MGLGGAGMKNLLVILLFCSITINIYQFYQTKGIEANRSEQRKKIVELKSQIEASENSLATAEETLKVLQLTISELENTKEQLMQENVEFQKQLEEMSKPEKSASTTQENVPEAYLAEKMPEKVIETPQASEPSQPSQPSQPAPSQPSSGGNTAFGFKLPDGATTNGIQVSGQAQVGNGSGNYSGIELQ